MGYVPAPHVDHLQPAACLGAGPGQLALQRQTSEGLVLPRPRQAHYRIVTVVFSPDSKRLVGLPKFSGSVTVWETASGKCLPSSADGIEDVHGFDRDGRFMVRVDGRYQFSG